MGRAMPTGRRPLRAAAVSLALLAAACAHSPDGPSPEEEYAVWLSEAPRHISVAVAPALPEPDLLSRDRKIGERVVKGAGGGVVGAGGTVLGGCMAGPLGCILGLLASPVGFVWGAAKGATGVETEVTHRPLAGQAGAGSLFRREEAPLDVRGMLLAALLREGRKAGRHEFRAAAEGGAAPPGGSGGPNEAILELSVETFGLLGDPGEDPQLSLVLAGSASLNAPDGPAAATYPVEYQGRGRRLSEWRANDAVLFRREIETAAEAVARDAIRRLYDEPTDDVTADVEAARD